MDARELDAEIAAGVAFWGYEDAGDLVGVMGVQRVRDVDLIRHAYVRPASQRLASGARSSSGSRREPGADAGRDVGRRRAGDRLLPPTRLRAGHAGAGGRAAPDVLDDPGRAVETSVVLAHRRCPARSRDGASAWPRRRRRERSAPAPSSSTTRTAASSGRVRGRRRRLGFLVGTRDGDRLEFRYSQLNASGETSNGRCSSAISASRTAGCGSTRTGSGSPGPARTSAVEESA